MYQKTSGSTFCLYMLTLSLNTAVNLKSLDTGKIYSLSKAVTKDKLESIRNRLKTYFGVKSAGSKENSKKGLSKVTQIKTSVISVPPIYSSWSKKTPEWTEKSLAFRSIIFKHQYLDHINLLKSKDNLRVAGLRLRGKVLQWVSMYTKEYISRSTQWPRTGLHKSTATK